MPRSMQAATKNLPTARFVANVLRSTCSVGLVCTTVLPCENLLAQEPSSQTPRIQWNDGTIDFHDPKLGIPHSHGSGPIADARALEAMTPAQKASYERKIKEAEEASHEKIARAIRFAQIAKDDVNPLAVSYRDAQQAFQVATIQLVMTLNEFGLTFDATTAEVDALDQKWFQGLMTAHESRKSWISKGAELFASDPTKYKNIGTALKEMLIYDMSADRVEAWAGVSSRLLAVEPTVLDFDWLVNLTSAALGNNEYDEAIRMGALLIESSEQEQAADRLRLYIDTFPNLKKEWERELELRKLEAEKNDNPQVELITSKGRVVIELFEDSAPNTVANFIYLVEKKYYDWKAFFRVENLTVAQTGCEKNDGSGSTGYTIASESTEDSYRANVRGSLALALGGHEGVMDTNSGSSQFYFCFMPLAHLNKEYTVFGRVIEGMENLSLLRHLNLADKSKDKEKSAETPDSIRSVKVLRKRDHEYRPTPHQGRLFN